MKKFLLILFIALGIFKASFANIKAPEFNLKDLNSQEHSITKYHGKTIFLIFWSESCSFCREELPIIEKLYKEYNENKDDIIFITFSKDELEPLQNFLKENNYSFPIITNSSIFNKYLINSIPTHYIVGQSGEVIQSIIGSLSEEKIRILIKDNDANISTQ